MPRKGNAYLLIDSLDRYLTTGGNIGTQNDSLIAQFNNTETNTCADFQIQSPGALINGYMGSLTITQIQLNYKIPTISPRNDTLYVYNETQDITQVINIPPGFYTPLEMAALLQDLFQNSGAFPGGFTVGLTSDLVPSGEINGIMEQQRTDSYQFDNLDPAGNPVGSTEQQGFVDYNINLDMSSVEYRINGFTFNSTGGDTWYFLNPSDPALGAVPPEDLANVYKTYKTLGINVSACQAQQFNLPQSQKQSGAPNFLYTPYIDIQSFALTQYQTIKDTDTSAAKKSGLIARIYLSGVAGRDPITTTDAPGSTPFFLTADLNFPKTIEWSKDQNVANLDFKLYDAYGDPIYWNLEFGFNTEFQMSILVSE